MRQIISATMMSLTGEYFCMRFELEAIEIGNLSGICTLYLALDHALYSARRDRDDHRTRSYCPCLIVEQRTAPTEQRTKSRIASLGNQEPPSRGVAHQAVAASALLVVGLPAAMGVGMAGRALLLCLAVAVPVVAVCSAESSAGCPWIGLHQP